MSDLKLGDWQKAGVVGEPDAIGTQYTRTILSGTYRTVRMPDGKEWMAEDLAENLAGSLPGVFGRYYPVATLSEVFPDGWRIPDPWTDWQAMALSLDPGNYIFSGREVSFAGGQLKEVGTTHWRAPNYGPPPGYVATDDFGFTLLPNYVDVSNRAGEHSYMWTSNPTFATHVNYSTSGFGYLGGGGTLSMYRFPIRLVREYVPNPPVPGMSGIHDLLVLPSGLAETTESLVQRIDIRLRTFAGEHWLNPELGVPWFRDFLTKAPDLAVCRQTLWDVIRGVRGVQTINRLELSIAKGTRILTITFAVNGTDSFTSTIPV